MKVCVVTGTRAESGLLYWLMKEIDNDESLQLQTIVTGMHLSPEFGLTYKAVEKEFKIDKKLKSYYLLTHRQVLLNQWGWRRYLLLKL